MTARRKTSIFALLFTGLAIALGVVACGTGGFKHGLVDLAMNSAYRSPPLRLGNGGRDGALQLLAGDFHCHVSPPDSSSHVGRDLPATIELAKRERLDFVVLTPHVRSRFFQDAAVREEVLERHRTLLRDVSAQELGGVQVFVGFEYSDGQFGHAGTAFGDLEATLAGLTIEDSQRDPGQFIDRYIDSGGIVIINHPLLFPVRSVIPIQWWDLSWRPLYRAGPFPTDIEAVHRRAHGYEAFNLAITHLRDRYLLGAEEQSIVDSIAAFDREILGQRRRITPLGGSDSHSHHLRATTFVLARGRSKEAIREAVVRGRTCVRSPEACSLFARPAGGATVGVGGAIDGATQLDVWIGADAPRGSIRGAEIIISGRKGVPVRPRETARVVVPPSECTLIRARAGAGFSAPIYVNCPFASSDGRTSHAPALDPTTSASR